jgi:ABC-type transporter Mla subunit MlaD
MNGVNVGTVNRVRILPDATVDFVIHIFRESTNIPKDAKFTAQGSVTGASTVTISAPTRRLAPGDILPKHVLPISEQPIGTPPLSIETFMAQSRGLGNRLTGILSQARPYGKGLLARLQHARANGAATTQEMRATAPALLETMQSTMTAAKANVARAQQILRTRDQFKLARMSAAFQRSAADMKETASALTALRRDPSMQSQVSAARLNVRAVTENLAGLSGDLAIIAKNPQTKAELLDAGARFRDLLKRI